MSFVSYGTYRIVQETMIDGAVRFEIQRNCYAHGTDEFAPNWQPAEGVERFTRLEDAIEMVTKLRDDNPAKREIVYQMEYNWANKKL